MPKMRKILTILLFVLNVQTSSAQNLCAAGLKYVKESYDEGRFWNCLDTIEHCLKIEGYNREEKIVALSFKAKVFLAIDSVYRAREVIQNILVLRDNYEPAVDDPDRYKNQFYFVKTQLASNTITSVSKKAEKLELAPATIHVITAEEILNRGYQSLENLLNDIPGFDVSRTNGLIGTTFYQRGYRSANNTDKTMILVDGVEDNEMYTQFAFMGKQLPIQSVKRVEIIYGPASSLYGANAFCGVINIITKDPTDLFKKEVTEDISQEEAKTEKYLSGQINAGSFNTKLLEMTGAVKLKNGITIQAVGKYFSSDENNLSQYSNWDGKWTEDDFGKDWYKKSLSKIRTQKNKRYIDSLIKRYDPTNTLFTYTPDSTLLIPTQAAIDKASNLDQSEYNKIPRLPGSTGKGDDPRKFKDPSIGQYLMLKVTLGDLILQAQLTDRNEGAGPDYIDKYFSVNSNFTNWQVRQQFISSRYTKRLGDKWFFYNAAYFRISDFGQNSRLTTFNGYAQRSLNFDSLLINKLPFWKRTAYFEQCKQFRDEFRTQYIINEKWDFLLGLEIRNGVFQSNYLTTSESDNAILFGTVPSAKGGNNLAVFDLATFSQLSYQNPAKKFNFSFGGRWDKNVVSENSDAGYSKFNPRISAVYYPGSWVFKLVYSEAIFAFPSFTKFSTSVTRELPTDLHPEEAINYEFSASKSFFNNKLNVDLSAYKSEYTNILVIRKTISSKDQYTNSPGVGSVLGAQLSIKYHLNNKMDFFCNATANNSQIFDTIPLRNGKDSLLRTADIALFSFNAGFGIYLFKQKVHLQLLANYVGEKYTGPGTTLPKNLVGTIPSFLLIHSVLNVNISKYITFQFKVNNLLDQQYISPGIRTATGSQSSFVPQPGRNFHGTMNFYF